MVTEVALAVDVAVTVVDVAAVVVLAVEDPEVEEELQEVAVVVQEAAEEQGVELGSSL